jgi:hypothetical protein
MAPEVPFVYVAYVRLGNVGKRAPVDPPARKLNRYHQTRATVHVPNAND